MKVIKTASLLCAVLLLAGCASTKAQTGLEKGDQRNSQAQRDMDRAFNL
jgi:major membrane immunogen (membrane-anchored lipoprotein)